jgi:hypothetical protein
MTDTSATNPTPTETPLQGGTSDDGVNATAFLLKLIAEGGSGLALGADGFYFQVSEKTGGETLLKTLDAIADAGFLIIDFNYGQALSFIVENTAVAFPQGMIRLGGSLAPLDPARLEIFEKSIIRDENEGYFEFFPGLAVPTGRDEFIAVLWKFGIKFGIDTASLEATLAEGPTKPGRYLVARAIPPIDGTDAKPVPKVNFQRSRTIKEPDASGHANLHFYECGFPQVPEGAGPHALLEKKAATPGRAGRSVSGKLLAPRAIKDFDLSKMAGAGTKVMEINGTLTIATDNGGYFIDVDSKQQISVSPHAKSSFAVGPKTGSFEVAGDRFEQCGDIEHQYVLIGRQIDIKPGSVRGKVISRAGNVSIEGGIQNGGQVEAEAGNVTVSQSVLGGRVVALTGNITVARAEGSVLIAREVDVTESAINCFIIADVIRITKAAGISFYAQNISIGQLDLNDSNSNPVAGFIVLRDNLNARKAIRRFEKRRQRLAKVDQMDSLIKEQGLADAWAALDARMSSGAPLSPDETHAFGPLLKPYDYVNRRRAMVAKDRAFFADPKSPQQYDAAIKAVDSFEASMKATVGISIQTMNYPADVAALLANADPDPAAVVNAASQSFYAYVSSDPSIAELTKREKKLQNFFLAFVSRMLAGTVINEARIRPLRSLALLKAPCVLGYDTLKQLAAAGNSLADPGAQRNEGAHIEINRDIVIPVVVDGYSIGRLLGVSDHGASIMFDDTQDNPPVFENLEEIQMVIQTGYIVERKGSATTNRPLALWEEQRYPFAITNVVENDSAGLVKIEGYYAHMNEEAFNRARRLRTQVEALTMRLKHE